MFAFLVDGSVCTHEVGLSPTTALSLHGVDSASQHTATNKTKFEEIGCPHRNVRKRLPSLQTEALCFQAVAAIRRVRHPYLSRSGASTSGQARPNRPMVIDAFSTSFESVVFLLMMSTSLDMISGTHGATTFVSETRGQMRDAFIEAANNSHGRREERWNEKLVQIGARRLRLWRIRGQLESHCASSSRIMGGSANQVIRERLS